MQKQPTTYRLFASLFALLLLFAPIVQSMAYDLGYEKISQAIKKDQNSDAEEDQSSNETFLYAASSFQAVITASIQLDFDLIDYLSEIPALITPLKEFVQIPILPTQSVYIQNICAYCIAPHAP